MLCSDTYAQHHHAPLGGGNLVILCRVYFDRHELASPLRATVGRRMGTSTGGGRGLGHFFFFRCFTRRIYQISCQDLDLSVGAGTAEVRWFTRSFGTS